MKCSALPPLLLSISFSAIADERKVEIKKTTSSTKIPKPRSATILPVVCVDTDRGELSVSFAALNDSYTLYVYDGSGGVVYQGAVISDGGRHAYQLPELEADIYTISIEGATTDFEGEFFAN